MPAAKKSAVKVTTAPGKDSGGSGVPATDVDRFRALFPGYSKAHGEYDISPGKMRVEESGKIKGGGSTKAGGATRAHYERHLNGVGPMLGSVLLLDDDTVAFGVIDYDKYKNTDLKAAQVKVDKLGLPLMVGKSKSGGAHFYCFLNPPAPASLMRERLAEWTAMLGMAKDTEQFPKQSARFNELDIGSWLNLPYYAALNPDVPKGCGVAEGQPLSLSAFLDAAEAKQITPAQLDAWAPAAGTEDLFQEGPPCLHTIHVQGGFAEGSRNNGMQGVMVYLRKRFPDDWATRVDSYNAAMAGLPSAEVQGIVKHNQRKQYNYSCRLAPLNAFCNRRVCLTRMYGVGEAGPESRGHDISGLTRYDTANGDEPMWGLEINGKRVMVANTTLYSRDEFNRACMAQANLLPIHMPPQKWLRYLSEIITTADIVQVPAEAGPSGQLWEWVESFCLSNVNALTREEVWLGKPWRDEGQIYFRGHDLFKYLDARRVKYASQQAVWQLLKARGGDSKFWKIKGRGFNVWHIPMPEPITIGEESEEPEEELQFPVSEEFAR